jgi:MtfA peptidase
MKLLSIFLTVKNFVEVDFIIIGATSSFVMLALISLFYYIKIKHYRHFFFVSRYITLGRKYRKILESKFPYYKKLCTKDKKKFEKRVQYFISTKQFIPRNMKEVTPEMKCLISATAIQLTFGFPGLNLASFKKIIIYPDSYYSMIKRTYHKGEVNPSAGIIVLSWKNFEENHMDTHSQKNLGLHEMAHALRLENRLLNEEYDFFDESILNQWDKLSKHEVEKIREGNDSFFRDYAGTNSDEFFAVAVENFFERSEEFASFLPEMYQTLVELLHQDPLRLGNPQGHTILIRS